MSNIGKPDRKLWLELNHPEEAEPLTPDVYLKFLYGSLVEALILFLVELSGHDVQGTQDEQEISGIKGHRDAIIDGVLVDVKSASTFSFKKFKKGKLKEDDPFGYISQILSYLEASQEDGKLKEKDKAAFLVVDKTLGHLTLDFHQKDQAIDWPKLFEQKKDMIKGDIPPLCYPSKKDGYKNKDKEFIENGNEYLDTGCSYCDYKKFCYPDMRVFLTSRGPKYFSKIVKEPSNKLIEITNGYPEIDLEGVEDLGIFPVGEEWNQRSRSNRRKNKTGKNSLV